MLSHDRWSKLKEVVDAALSLPSSSRSTFLEYACMNDLGLFAAARAYVAEYAGLGSFLGGSLQSPAGIANYLEMERAFDRLLRLTSGLGADFAERGRFREIESLGAGAFGEVYRAYDEMRRQTIAIKVAALRDAAALANFKQEFRSVAQIQHENIVAIYELFGDERRWFFTMEYLRARSFNTYVDNISAEDGIERLRSSVRQLVGAVLALHKLKILHRDIKPSNVLITEEGRVVVLDFGLAQGVDDRKETSTRTFAGTPAYCSPEQASGHAVTEATDWYAVGVMLFEALTGSRPFLGDWLDVIRRKQEQDGPAPSERTSGVPADLDQLCRKLLRRDPEARPCGDEIASQVGAAMDIPSRKRTKGPTDRLAGRDNELSILRNVWRDVCDRKPALVVVRGKSGIGKTRLISTALSEMQQEGALVFYARCYSTESVPYKGIDELVELLARHLRQLPRSELEAFLPSHFSLLADIFPSLRLLAPDTREDGEVADALEKRRRAFGALWQLCGRLSVCRKLVLAIDDLQWGDIDNMACLGTFLREQSALPILLLLAYRSEDAGHTPLLLELAKALDASAASLLAVHQIDLAPLDARESAEMVLGLLDENQATEDLVRSIIDSAGGDPFLIAELSRGSTSSARPESGEWDASLVLQRRIRELPAPARRLLEMVAVAGQPLDFPAASRAWQSSDDLLAARKRLIHENLVREAGDCDALVSYHDRIREAACGALDQEAFRLWHYRLACALAEGPSPDPERLAGHFEGAALAAPSARYARLAADRANAVFAFERAAHFYAMAYKNTVAESGVRSELLSLEGEALGNAGRGLASASRYLAAAAEATRLDQLPLRANAAAQYLRSGHLTRALDILPPLMREIGINYPRTTRGVIAALLWTRLRLWIRLAWPKRTKVSSLRLVEIDVCWSVALGISAVDPLRSALFCARHLLLALDLDEPGRLARALAGEATQRAATDGGYGISDYFLNKSFQEAERCADPRAKAFVIAMRGVLCCLRGEWRRSYVNCSEAAAQFLNCKTGPGWERNTAIMYTISMRFLLGEWPAVLSQMPGLLREAEERGDLYATLNFRLLTSYHFKFLMEDNPGKAADLANELLEEWGRKEPDIQHYYVFTALADSCVYSINGCGAYEAVENYWSGLQRAGIFRLSLTRIFGSYLRAKCALVRAADPGIDPGERLRMLTHALAIARRLAREPFEYARSLGVLLEAAVAAGGAQRENALALLLRAIPLLRKADLAPWQVSAEYWLAQLTRDRQSSERSLEWLRTRGCARPDRIAFYFAPGEWNRIGPTEISNIR